MKKSKDGFMAFTPMKGKVYSEKNALVIATFNWKHLSKWLEKNHLTENFQSSFKGKLIPFESTRKK
ncbi:MAG: hypothetical protein PW788_00765 [Micavibrio sp.]|nr:hypothetical protein [Micavibrio sp.]